MKRIFWLKNKLKESTDGYMCSLIDLFFDTVIKYNDNYDDFITETGDLMRGDVVAGDYFTMCDIDNIYDKYKFCFKTYFEKFDNDFKIKASSLTSLQGYKYDVINRFFEKVAEAVYWINFDSDYSFLDEVQND